jgi:hypothetical protein
VNDPSGTLSPLGAGEGWGEGAARRFKSSMREEFSGQSLPVNARPPASGPYDVQPFKHGKGALCDPVFAPPLSTPFFHLMRTYNRRLAWIARSRRERERLGRYNASRRYLFKGYTLGRSGTLPLLTALGAWLRLEIREGWRTWWPRPAIEKRCDPLMIPVRRAPQR